ncbi:MAG: SdpI family protein [Humibacter sp.]
MGTAVSVLAWVFTVLLAVLFVTCVLASRDRVSENRYFGLKLPALLRSEAAWRNGHRAAILPAGIMVVIALVCAIIGLSVPAVYWGSIAAFVIGVVWTMLAATRAARATPEDS